MASAGGRPSWQKMVSVGTSIVPPGHRPPPAATPDTSPVVTTTQVTASIHDFAVSLGQLVIVLYPRLYLVSSPINSARLRP